MKRRLPLFIICATFTYGVLSADLREGLISYWPLDSVDLSSSTTPDIVSGNHLKLVNISDSSVLAAGKFAQCFNFNANRNQLCYFRSPMGTDTGLPATRNAAYSVLLWVKATGSGQSDLRYFCESDVGTTNNNPLYSLGTHRTGADSGSRIYLRNSNGVVLVDNTTSKAVLDGTWHHVAMTYDGRSFAYYIDGETNVSALYAADISGRWDTTAIGGIVRASLGSYFTGSVDDVAVWARPLSRTEIREVMMNSIQTPVPRFEPQFALQPTGNTNLLVGGSLILNAGAYGARPLSYQWRKDGRAITGASGPVLSIPIVSIQDSGDYALIVSNSQGTATSAVARVLVHTFIPEEAWDAASEFSTTANPAGPWSYGRKWRDVDLMMDLFNRHYNPSLWYLGNSGGGPAVQIGPLLWAKENGNGLPTVRWTCPSDGVFRIAGRFTAVDLRACLKNRSPKIF